MNHKGFTLVELLVVIAIIGMLVGLLLPAVQQAREAARRMQCNNNLKQLSLACINFESTIKTFPCGGWGYAWGGDPDSGLGYKSPGSWMYQILPMLEQNSLYQLPSDGYSPAEKTDPNNSGMATLLQTPLSTFHCPSRRTPKLYLGKNRTQINFTTQASGVAKEDYAGNIGYSTYGGETVPFTNIYPSKSELASWGEHWPDHSSKFTGVLFLLSRTTVGMIKDGTTNTFLLGEKYLSPDYYEEGGSESVSRTDDYPVFCGGDGNVLRSTFTGNYNSSTWKESSSPMRPLQDRSGYEGTQSYRFGSPHTGGFGMAMCDGSVQTVGYDTDLEVFYCKGSRNDGQVESGITL